MTLPIIKTMGSIYALSRFAFVARGLSTAALLGATLIGCIPKHPTKTTRPVLNVSPWQEKTVTSSHSGEQYRYLFLPGPRADAPAMLLLPGGFFDHRIWLNTTKLRAHFNVYALDWPDSSSLYKARVADMGEVVQDFLQTLGISSLYVAGVSAGSYGAIEVALRQDLFRVKALFLLSTAMFAINRTEVKRRLRMTRIALGFKPEKLRSVLEYRIDRTEFDSVPGPIQQAEIFYVRPYSYYSQLFHMVQNQGTHKQPTQTIDCPTLILHGTSDEVMPIENARLSTSVFSNASFLEFKDYKHAMVFTHGPQIADSMLDFLMEKKLLSLGEETGQD